MPRASYDVCLHLRHMSLLTDAFAALRQDELGTPEAWRPVYRRALIDAFEQGRLGEAAELTSFAAVALEAQGHYSDALAELEFAIPRVTESPDVSATLLATLAVTHAFASNDAAMHAIDAAESLRPRMTDPYTLELVESLAAIVGLIFFQSGGVDRATRIAKEAREEGYAWIGQGVDIWTIPAIAAAGSVRNARPWSNMLAAEVEALKSNYRRADTAAIEFCLRTAFERPEFDPTPFETMRRNRMAAWRARTAALRGAVLDGDRARAALHLDAMEELAGSLNPGHTWGLPVFRAVAMGLTDATLNADIAPPEQVTLVNLPAVLAALETVSAVGSQQQAADWLHWYEQSFPTDVLSSLEWPASVERLTGLLMARAGYERAGITSMERGLRRLRSDDAPVERAVCETQLAEMLAHGSAASPRRWPGLRREGTAALRAFGVNHLMVSSIATDAIAWGRVAAAEPRLSPREVEVLARLADGLSYREVGEELGIEWRTAQAHARNIYAKLGVTGKLQAARRALELGII
ncbi:MAG: response regulator transcription factor [Dehalococcoidia bacterium]